MFKKAKPIFLQGLAEEKNVTALFSCEPQCKSGAATLRLTGATRYRVYLNGEFVHYGPARAAHGCARVDELQLQLDIDAKLDIYVSSSNVASFDGVKQPGFLQAELEQDGQVIAATGYDFDGYLDERRVRKVMRFSYQRHFSEVYCGDAPVTPCPIEIRPAVKHLLPRDVPIPCCDVVYPLRRAAFGKFQKGDFTPGSQRFIYDVPAKSEGYAVAELEKTPLFDYCALKFEGTAADDDLDWCMLRAGIYDLFDFGAVYTGFIVADIDVVEECELIVSYEDICPELYVSEDRVAGQYVNMLAYYLKPGYYHIEGFDPCELRYVQFTALSGELRVSNIALRQYVHPECGGALNSGDVRLDRIYAAAVRTFRQNTLDVFMDCPTRERAGWLCDSYFTAQSEFTFTGDNRVERAFLRNFVLGGQLPALPDGMLPMCYPAEALNGEFIPQWAMWYIIELEGALKRGGLDKAEFGELCYRLAGFFSKYLNEYGLLENLPGWNFVEWSRCNSWTRAVNYPTNFLYARMLRIIGELYGDEAFLIQAENVRTTALRMSFDGKLFTDNAVRNANGELVNTGNTSETCQYYAMRFGGADIFKDPKYEFLRRAYTDVFGTYTDYSDQLHRDVEPSTPFIGIYLRLETLLDNGMYQRALDEVKRFFGGMERLTGTLWEHKHTRGSLDHGFASYAGVVIRRALAGLRGQEQCD